MQNEIKNCQNCKKDFQIEPEDFEFYAKMKVPAPTWCPGCRMMRRFLWRNERTLYNDKCVKTGKRIISMFAPEAGFTVYDRDVWWGDSWDSLSYGKPYDFSKSFFEQFGELMRTVPLAAVGNTNMVRSDYCNHSADCKDCYLTHASWKGENVAYGQGVLDTKDSFDLYTVMNSQKCSNVSLSTGVFQCHESSHADECMNSWFLSYCTNVHNSVGAINIRNRKYVILNESFSKEEYEEKIKELDFGSYKNLQAFKQTFKALRLTQPYRFADMIKTVDTTGDNVLNAKNCKYLFDGYGDVEDSKYVVHVIQLKQGYDLYGGGAKGELIYEALDCGLQGSQNAFAALNHSCFDTRYTYMCYNASHLFGCVGVRGKKYCILNYEYTKEEYEELVPKIIEHMNSMPYIDAQGRTYGFGEFFPPAIAPFAYNETIGQEYAHLKKEESLAYGFGWKEREQKHHEVTIQSENLPDHITDTPDSIISEVISCPGNGREETQCISAFKILPEELTFYRSINHALPRYCSNCRHYERLAERNPLKLWHRSCMNKDCSNEFETAFAPERPEIIYCESCYQKEVM